MAATTSEHMLGEVMLFDPVMHQSYLLSEFNREFKPIASIQPGAPIEFNVKGSQKLYVDLNNSRIKVLFQVLAEDGATALGAANAIKTSMVNLPFNTMWKEASLELNGKTVSDPNSMYNYRAYLETLIEYNSHVKKTRLLTEGWHQDKPGAEIEETDPANNAGLVARKDYCAASPKVEMVGRPHLDLFHQDKLIPPGVDLALKLLPADNAFALISHDIKPKIKIHDVTFIVRTKQLTESAELAHRELVLQQNYRLPFTRVQMKHFAIAKDLSTIRLEGIFNGPLPDLVVVGLVGDKEFAGDYKANPYAFRNFGVKRIEMTRNGVRCPRHGYTPNFQTKEYIKDYITFQEQLGFDQGDKCVHLTPAEWADGFNLYTFKLTDGPIGSGTYGPRSQSNNGSASLEIEFAAATAKDLKLVVMYQGQGILEIDQFNNIVVS